MIVFGLLWLAKQPLFRQGEASEASSPDPIWSGRE
jgi:hypothetical protein